MIEQVQLATAISQLRPIAQNYNLTISQCRLYVHNRQRCIVAQLGNYQMLWSPEVGWTYGERWKAD